MKKFLRRHRAVNLWAVILAVLFMLYAAVIGSRAAANAAVAVTQVIKDAFAALWYIVPFSVVEWLYVAFILLAIVWVVVLAARVRKSGEKFHTAYSGVLSLACLCLSVWWFYCMMWGVNYYADGFQDRSGIYAQAVDCSTEWSIFISRSCSRKE